MSLPGAGIVERLGSASESSGLASTGESAKNRMRYEEMTGHLLRTGKGQVTESKAREIARNCAIRADRRGDR